MRKGQKMASLVELLLRYCSQDSHLALIDKALYLNKLYLLNLNGNLENKNLNKNSTVKIRFFDLS